MAKSQKRQEEDAETRILLRQTITAFGGVDNVVEAGEEAQGIVVSALHGANQIIKRGRGRPEKSEDERTSPTTVRLTPDEKAWCESQPGGLSKYFKRLVSADRKRKRMPRSN